MVSANQEIKTLVELKKQADHARQSLKEFYDRLPTIRDSAVVIAELQIHIDELLDHIIDCHNFFDSAFEWASKKFDDPFFDEIFSKLKADNDRKRAQELAIRFSRLQSWIEGFSKEFHQRLLGE
jgi:predicted neutral ceramidase superfamily lipid hydrolase